MRVRALDELHDWTFGKGQNNYKTRLNACVQDIDTRLYEFLGDCFFNNGAGIDWFGLIGGKDTEALRLAIVAVILNTEDVTGIRQLETSLIDRGFRVVYEVQTSFGTAASNFTLDQTNL